MAYKAKTHQGGYDQFQRKALPHIQAIGQFWGIKLADKDWEYFGHNSYGRKGERDTCNFGDMEIERILQRDGVAVTTALEPRWMGLQTLDNDAPAPLEFKQKFKEVARTKKIDESSSLVGWSLEISHTHKVEASGSVAGFGGSASMETSIDAETHGEIYKHNLTETEEIIANEVEVGCDVPARTIYYVQQRQSKAIIEMPIQQFIALQLKFEIDDWKELDKKKDKGLWGSSRKQKVHGRNSDTRSLLVIKNSEDFLQLVTGIHPDYPLQRTDHTTEKTPIAKHVKWLLNPMNRAIRVDMTQKYEHASSGYTRIVDHADEVITQAFPDEEF